MKDSLPMIFKASALGALALAGLCASASAASPAARIAVKGFLDGRVRLLRGNQKRILSLGHDISGCKSDLYDPTTGEVIESGATFEVVDQTVKAPYTYMVLLVSTPPNCNVQGECGAGGADYTLLWLKLTRDLKLAGKQAFAMDDCRGGRSSRIERKREPGSEAEPEIYIEIKAKDLPWTGDVLRIEYDEEDNKAGRLIYDRKNPDAGFQQAPLEPSPAVGAAAPAGDAP